MLVRVGSKESKNSLLFRVSSLTCLHYHVSNEEKKNCKEAQKFLEEHRKIINVELTEKYDQDKPEQERI